MAKNMQKKLKLGKSKKKLIKKPLNIGNKFKKEKKNWGKKGEKQAKN